MKIVKNADRMLCFLFVFFLCWSTSCQGFVIHGQGHLKKTASTGTFSSDATTTTKLTTRRNILCFADVASSASSETEQPLLEEEPEQQQQQQQQQQRQPLERKSYSEIAEDLCNVPLGELNFNEIRQGLNVLYEIASQQREQSYKDRGIRHNKLDKRGRANQKRGDEKRGPPLHRSRTNHNEVSMKILERILQEEIESGTEVLKPGVLMNVVKTCRFNDYFGGPNNLNRIDNIIEMLEQTNNRLADYPELLSNLIAIILNNHSIKRDEAQMNRLYAAKSGIKPNEYDYGLLLASYIKRSNTIDAQRILKQMEDEYKSGILQYGPNTINYNSVINRIIQRCHKNYVQVPVDDQSLSQITSIFTRMKTIEGLADEITYNTVLNAYATRGMASKAESLLQEMHDLYDAGQLQNGPDVVSYNCVLNALARCNLNEEENDDNNNDNISLQDRSENLVRRMKEVYNINPTTRTYGTLLNCFARNGSIKKAQELLQQMHEMYESGQMADGPGSGSYTIVCNALADRPLDNDDEDDGVYLAEQLIQELNDRYNNVPDDGNPKSQRNKERLRPDVVLYNSLLNCYSKRGMADKAQELLQQMDIMHKDGLLQDRPNRKSMSCVLNAIYITCKADDNDNVINISEDTKDRVRNLLKSRGWYNDKFTIGNGKAQTAIDTFDL